MPLPPGLILNPATGELSGTPTVAGVYSLALTVRDVLGNKRELTDDVTINAYTPMTWSGDMGNLMDTRAPTGITVARAGGLAPYVYSVFSGALPIGLSLNAGTGAFTGTPNTPGGYAFTLRVTDALGQIRDYVLAGTVAENLVASYDGEVRGTMSVPYDQPVTVSGGTLPYSYSLQSGALPPGLVYDLGHVHGTPSAPSTASAVLRVTDAYGFTADTASVNFDIAAYPTISGGLPRGMVGKAYSSSALVAAGGHTPYAWSAFGLPPGLSINAGTGQVTGTPTQAGIFTGEEDFTDVLLVQAQHTQSIEIAAALSISGSYTAAASRLIPYPTFNPVVTGGYLPRSFAISVGALPPGLNLNTSTGAISGTPTTQGSYTATLRVTDADGSQATMAFNVDVAGDLAMTGSVANTGTTTVAYTGDTLGRTGGSAPFTWSTVVGTLPPGIVLNTSTGDLTGTPTTPGTYNFTIRVTDANQSFAQAAFTITVAAYPTLSGTLGDASNGLAYSDGLAAAGGHAPLVWDLSTGALPGGLSINSSDGRITGTPNANGTFNFTVRITDNKGNVATRAGTITTYAAPSLSGTLTATGEEGIAYSNGLGSAGGKAPLVWSVQGTLPPGLTINSGTGLISGTIDDVVVTTGTHKLYSFTVKITDALGRTASSNQSIDVFKHVSVNLAPPPPTDLTRTVAASTVVGASFGDGSYTFAVISGALPTGLSLTAGTGAITGTPSANGTYNFTIRVTDGLGATATRAFQIVVWSPMTLTGTPQDGTVGVGYSFQAVGGGGKPPYSYFHVAGTLPTGLSLNSAGQIVGTPTAAGTFNFTLRAYSATNADSADLVTSITIVAFPTFSLNYGRGVVSEPYSGTITTGGGKTPKTYARVAGAFPPGLALNASTGALTGTPSTQGVYTGTVRMTDALGNTIDRAFSINIAPAIQIAANFASPATQGIAYNSTVGASGGYAPYSWSTVAGAVPTNTTRTNGTISGTPNTVQTANFTLRVTDADGHTFDKAFSIVVQAGGFTLAAAPNPASDYAFSGGATVNVQCTSTVTPTGGNTPFTYAWSFVSASGSAGAFAVGGAATRTLTVSHTGSSNYLRTEIWRCTVTDNIGIVRTIDVTFELEIEVDTGTGCPDADCVLPDGRRVGDLKVGDMVECIDVVTGKRFQRAVRSISTSIQPRVRLCTSNGGTITQSASTRMVLPDGREVTSLEMIDEDLIDYNGTPQIVEFIEELEPGLCVNVDLGDVMFFAGDGDGVFYATHNLKPP